MTDARLGSHVELMLLSGQYTLCVLHVAREGGGLWGGVCVWWWWGGGGGGGLFKFYWSNSLILLLQESVLYPINLNCCKSFKWYRIRGIEKANLLTFRREH